MMIKAIHYYINTNNFISNCGCLNEQTHDVPVSDV